MVELISRVSKGTRMDQIYIPKNRQALPAGSYVVVKLLEAEKKEAKPIFYDLSSLEPIKTEIIHNIIKTVEQHINNENIIITGSFLDRRFRFNDIDVLLIVKERTNISSVQQILENKTGAKIHLVQIKNKELIKGLSTDPLYRVMLSRCVSKVRFIHKVKREINYRLLDLHLLRSKPLMDSFDFLTGYEKYEMVRNLVAIRQFIDKKEVSKQAVDTIINNLFGSIDKLKNNLISKKDFLKKYKKIYSNTENNIMEGVKNEPKQK